MRLGTCLLFEGRTLQGANPKLADFCSAPLAGYYAAVDTYAPGRSGQHADNILNGFSGTPQVDGYEGYNRLLKRPTQDVTLAYCWAHARRKLHDVTQSGAAPIAQEGLAQIQALYRIEKDLRGLPADQRSAARQKRSRTIIDAFELWLAQSRARVSSKSPTGEALKYIAKYWDGLCLFWTCHAFVPPPVLV